MNVYRRVLLQGVIVPRASLAICFAASVLVSGCGRDTLIGIAQHIGDNGGSLVPPAGVGGNGGTETVPSGAGGNPVAAACATISTTPGQQNDCGFTPGIAISPDGTLLATVTQNVPGPYLHVWRLSDGKLLYEPSQASGVMGAAGVSFSPDGKFIATATWAPSSAPTTNTVHIWDAATGALVATLPTQCGDLANAATFSHDGTLLATVGFTKAFELWKVADWSRVRTIPYGVLPMYSATFSPDDSQVITTLTEDAIAWNVSDGTKKLDVGVPAFLGDFAAYSPNGALILGGGGDDGSIQILDPSLALLQSLPFIAGVVPAPAHGAIAWIDNDRFLADVGSPYAQEWTKDPASPTGPFAPGQSWKLPGNTTGIAVAADGSRFVVAGAFGFEFLTP